MIPVTKPFLPPIEKYQKYVSEIWERRWLTNNGPLVQELELKLKQYLGFDGLLFLNNGTIALQIAIKALELKGEIITTPFSYVATTSSIVWEGCNPVFADIEPSTFNIDPIEIEKAITKNTVAILATHVYGNPCNIEAIQEIATRNNLKVIYDGAHAFGVKYRNKSIFEFGDISTTSFHATKLFHSIEGGAVFSPDKQLVDKMGYLRNFGHKGIEAFADIGINGKNSEFHAAMGLCNILFIDEIIARRKEQTSLYNEHLSRTGLGFNNIHPNAEYNYSYYPVVFNDETELLRVQSMLNSHDIFPRRYFYPSLDKLPYLNKRVDLPISNSISKRVLCLPMYHDLDQKDIEDISQIIIKAL